MSVFEAMKKNPSVSVAKDRLRLLLVSDRICCGPGTLETMQQELYQTVSKYMEVTPEEFDVQITRSQICIRLSGEKE